MRPLHLREWPIFHALWKAGQGTAPEILHALAEETTADRHSVRATLDDFVADGYARAEGRKVPDGEGREVEVVVYSPVVPVEDALRILWPQIREMILDRDRYLELFQRIVADEA